MLKRQPRRQQRIVVINTIVLPRIRAVFARGAEGDKQILRRQRGRSRRTTAVTC